MVRRRRRARAVPVERGTLRLDPERSLSTRHCENCGREFRLVKGFVSRDDVPHAVYFAACHEHDGVREAWIDLILGTFGEDASSDHVTFGARVGPVLGQDEPAATLVQAAIPYGDSAIFGQKLTREEALEHPLLPGCWEVVDFVLIEDEAVNAHVYGASGRRVE
jgi:hypothetical protein